MNIDLIHNKIVKDTISERFVEEVFNGLVPLLEAEYGDAILGIQMYEDYIADNFVLDGEIYYPLTLVFDTGVARKWIKWGVSSKLKYPASPYSYIGEAPLNFALCAAAPTGFDERLLGRGIYFEGGCASLSLQSVSNDKTFLAGKYSQTFVDELTRQISREIERTFSIEGLEGSTLSLLMVFAPETYMEHVVENTTYRRLLVSAKGCSARDLWIKWTRNNGAVPYTISDNVTESDITFEIAEDVPQKIREKEYRFLVRTSVEKYQSAMGRKNITEWRDLIKRIIKRDEVVKIELPEPELMVDDINEKLASCLGEVDSVAESVEETLDNEDINELLKAAIAREAESASYESDEVTLSEYADDALRDEADGEEVLEMAALDGSSLEIDDLYGDSEEAFEISDSPVFEEIEASDIDATAEEEFVEEIPEDEPELSFEEQLRAREEEMRREIEEKLRREYEEKIRESELIRLEKERLEAEARAKEEERLRKEAEARAEAERLRREKEEKERAELLERERIAEEARRALAEEQRKQKEREALEARRRAEEARLAEEKRRAEEEARRVALREAEERKIREEMLRRKEEEERAKAPKVQTSAPSYTYTSKCVKLIFRRPIDPNITKRIHEIILTTIKYYHKENVYMKIKATVPDANTVKLDFIKVPEQETQLIVDIIQVLGKSNLGITKATLE